MDLREYIQYFRAGIISLLINRKKVAVFYNEEEYTDACIKADELRNEYDVTMYARPKKLGKFLGKIEMQGYYGFLVYW